MAACRSVSLAPLSGRYLSFAEREEIAILHAQRCGVREIARRIGRSPSTISRELRRNARDSRRRSEYRATTAQWHADRRARRPKAAKLAANARLRQYVQDRLAGAIAAPDGSRWRAPGALDRSSSRSPPGPALGDVVESGADRNRLRVDFPDDESMRISHEAIYQALYVQGRGALRRELTACLRTGRALRVPRARTRGRGKKFVSPEIMISERPAEADDRAVPGHWEGDLILGLDSSAIGTLVERTTRFTMLLHLPRMDGHGQPRVKNGPALAGHGAEAVRDAIASTIITLPEQLRRSLTWDQGAEMAQHAQLRIDTGLPGLLLRPAQPLAARHQREHQRPAAPVLPQGHRPQPAHPDRARRRRGRAQQPAPQDPRLEDTSRSPQRAPPLARRRNGLSAGPYACSRPPSNSGCSARRAPEQHSHGRRGEPRRFAARTHPPDQIHFNTTGVATTA